MKKEEEKEESNKFKILHFGLNFVCDLAQKGGSKIHCFLQYFSSI